MNVVELGFGFGIFDWVGSIFLVHC